MPIPAEKSIAIHDAVESLGLSVGSPSRIVPTGLSVKAMHAITITKTSSR